MPLNHLLADYACKQELLQQQEELQQVAACTDSTGMPAWQNCCRPCFVVDELDNTATVIIVTII